MLSYFNIIRRILINLIGAKEGYRYLVTDINTGNQKMNKFLFSLGCCQGEYVTVVAKVSNIYIVVIKDSRYSIDKGLL